MGSSSLASVFVCRHGIPVVVGLLVEPQRLESCACQVSLGSYVAREHGYRALRGLLNEVTEVSRFALGRRADTPDVVARIPIRRASTDRRLAGNLDTYTEERGDSLRGRFRECEF